MKDIFDKTTLSVLRALDDSPTRKAIRAIENSSIDRVMRDLDNSSTQRILRNLENSSTKKTIQEIEESPITKMIRNIDNSSTLRTILGFEESAAFFAIRRLHDSRALNAIKGLEHSPMLDAFTTVSSRITHGYGVLEFSEAYRLLVEEYEEQLIEGTVDPLDNLAEAVKSRAAQAPFGLLSAEFYLSLICALFLFYLSQLNGEQSEDRLLEKLGDMEQTISVQLDALKDDSQRRIFWVADRAVNLRNGPDLENEVLNVLQRNQKVVQIEVSGEWMKVEYFDYVTNTLKRGWVCSQYFILVDNEID